MIISMRIPLTATILSLLLLSAPAWGDDDPPTFHHAIAVEVDPGAGQIAVVDRISLPPQTGPSHRNFVLHAGLGPEVVSGGGAVEALGGVPGHPHLERFRLHLPPATEEITIRYGGTIVQPQFGIGQRGAASAPISGEGVHLDGNSYWYPNFGSGYVTFDLEVTLPPGWRSVSQGVGKTIPSGERWSEGNPQRDIQLVAAPFHLYRDDDGPVPALAFLRSPDEGLARRYLEATHRYIDLYSRLIGPYPYGKFALVEHFWESGLGMPSFTLLGSRVIRLPFILHSSYPHEILHNWWGNGVYIDYDSGNWGEGLTSYMADHLLREEAGEGADYRRRALQRYTDYVTGGRDFPLTGFRSRHTDTAQAIGYDKTLMFFHMLRRSLGDEGFIAGVRELYRSHLFRRASFDDVRAAFEAATGRDLGVGFAQWVERAGAPELHLGEVRATEEDGRWRLSFIVEQRQEGPIFAIDLPVAIQVEGHDEALETVVRLEERRREVEIGLPARPWRLYADPHFDLMRRLDHREVPAALSRLLGAERVAVLLPAAAPPAVLEGWRAFAASLPAEGRLEVHLDSDFDALPADRSIWLLGAENRFYREAEGRLTSMTTALPDSGTRLREGRAAPGTSAVRTLPHPGEPSLALAVVDHTSDLPPAGLAPRLHHYGRYSYLLFADDGAENLLRGEWSATGSPLAPAVGQPDGALPPPSPPSFAPRPPLSAVAD